MRAILYIVFIYKIFSLILEKKSVSKKFILFYITHKLPYTQTKQELKT